MYRKIRSGLAAGAALAFVALVAAPAEAQVPDVPSLGFQVDGTEGQPGDVVNGQVDTDDVAANCTTDLDGFQARFTELFQGPFANGAAEGELFDRFFPSGDFDFTNHAQLAYQATGFVALGIVGDPDIAAGALPQTFVMTFADIATQQPVGELGHFDPATGAGSATVPDVDPGQWAVAAACVGPSLDIDTLEAGIRQSGEFLESIGAPVGPGGLTDEAFTAFIQDYLDNPDATFIDFLQQVGPSLLQPIVEFDALGFQIFCVQDADGQCPDGQEPPTTTPGQPTQPTQPSAPVAPPATPVPGQPTFTG